MNFARRAALLGVAPVAAVVAGVVLLSDGGTVSTDNAYVKADIAAVSPEIDGRVARVLVDDNQAVARGDVLFEIDRRPFRIALEEAEAELAAARQRIESIRAVYLQSELEVTLAEERARFLGLSYERQKRLKTKGFAAQKAFDEAEHDLAMARQGVIVAKQQNIAALADLGGDPEIRAEAHPLYRAALAKRDRAALDLERATVRSPVAGRAANVTLGSGEYVEAGDPVMAVVGSDRIWVEANLKEVKLTNIGVGQRAEIRVDAFPDRAWPAVVESISGATGAEFSILPPQNATGNWVKVVQRVPVRLTFQPASDLHKLRAGMSVRVSIDTGRSGDAGLLVNRVNARQSEQE